MTLAMIALYLLCCVLLFWSWYSEGLEMNFRMPKEYYQLQRKINNMSWWKFFFKEQVFVRQMFMNDFFGLHHPWSWSTAVRFRIRDAHEALLRMTHEKGWTAADCHDPANHEQIARDCFISRKRFWAKNLFTFFTAPLRLVLMFVLAIILFFYELGLIAKDAFQRIILRQDC